MPLREAIVQDGRPVRLPDLACAGKRASASLQASVDHIDGIVQVQRDLAVVGSPELIFPGERVPEPILSLSVIDSRVVRG